MCPIAATALRDLARRAFVIRLRECIPVEERLQIMSAMLARVVPDLDVEFFQWEPFRPTWLSMYATSWAQKQAVNSAGRLFIPFVCMDAA
ncbi:unnamed protein product, partial [Amoebophrya sp. A25]|eukprot:GSA25T00013719001.1